MTKQKARPLSVLKQMWGDLFDEKCVSITNPDDEYQGLLMLMEIALTKTKYISTNNFNLKSMCEKHIAELEWKTQECNKLKAEVNRLESSKCHKCSLLEAELLHYKKESLEAQNRIQSIANILKLGDNIEDVEGHRKNSAMTLVSQMLLEESPNHKKRCLVITKSSPVKENIINSSCDGVIAETAFTEPFSPVKNLEKMDIITSPGEKVSIVASPGGNPVLNIVKDQISKSVNLPVTSVRRSPRRIKKNLTADLDMNKLIKQSPQKKLRLTNQCADQLSLNGSLVDYVKDVNSELDKIWFSNDTVESKNRSKRSNNNGNISDETPQQEEVSKTSIWKFKEARGPSEISGSKRLRQMKLNLSLKNKEVDLCSLDGYDGGSLTSVNKVTVTSNSGKDGSNDSPKEIESPSSDDFRPEATSTQKNVTRGEKKLKSPKTTRSPNYKYKREAVRKRAERMKLDGWGCPECAEYYGAVDLSSSKVKSRMNKCSRHRDKFGQLNQTPPDYWNPIFPDTEECRRKRLYVSVRDED